MSTTVQNNYASDNDTLTVPISALQAINQGDIVKIASNLAVPVDTPATDVPFGVARDTNPVVSLGDTLTKITVYRKGLFRFFLKAGDTATFNAKLYISDAQVVTTTQPGAGIAVGHCRELASTLGAAGNVTRVLVEFNPEANS